MATRAASRSKPSRPSRQKAATTAGAKPLVAPAAVPQSAPAVPAPGADAARQKREKLVRDSFTMPESDYSLIAALKARALSAGFEVKKSELLRAGLLTLSRTSTVQLKELVATMPKIKTGRPGKKKKK